MKLFVLFFAALVATYLAQADAGAQIIEAGKRVMLVVDCDRDDLVDGGDYGLICPEIEPVAPEQIGEVCASIGPSSDWRIERFCRSAKEPATPSSEDDAEVFAVLECGTGSCYYFSPRLMSWVWVLAVQEGRLLIDAHYSGRHGRSFYGWVSAKHVVSVDQFVRVDDWPNKYLLAEVCVEWEGCRKISFTTSLDTMDLELEIAFAEGFDTDCPFERRRNGHCESRAYVLKHDRYLLFVADVVNGPVEFLDKPHIPFLIMEDRRLCWAPAWQDHGLCMPLDTEYFQPATD